MITTATLSYAFKRAFLWVKGHWHALLTAVVVLSLAVAYRRSDVDLSGAIKKMRDANKKEVDILKRSYEKETSATVSAVEQHVKDAAAAKKEFEDRALEIDASVEDAKAAALKRVHEDPSKELDELAKLTGFKVKKEEN